MGLRNPYEDKSLKNPQPLPNTDDSDAKEENIIQDRVEVGRGISALTKDDRNARVDVVRRTMITPTPALK